ncbi:hypothetical protein B0H10DRAFT_1350024 [Mycena sp. CBHHK59/15]|nr:hypothetical protein B0H10DRAFT_1350024 [Mycena sp. CBHHK59/15]
MCDGGTIDDARYSRPVPYRRRGRLPHHLSPYPLPPFLRVTDDAQLRCLLAADASSPHHPFPCFPRTAERAALVRLVRHPRSPCPRHKRAWGGGRGGASGPRHPVLALSCTHTLVVTRSMDRRMDGGICGMCTTGRRTLVTHAHVERLPLRTTTRARHSSPGTHLHARPRGRQAIRDWAGAAVGGLEAGEEARRERALRAVYPTMLQRPSMFLCPPFSVRLSALSACCIIPAGRQERSVRIWLRDAPVRYTDVYRTGRVDRCREGRRGGRSDALGRLSARWG